MSLAKRRQSVSVKGLGTAEVRSITDAETNFSDIGYLDSSVFPEDVSNVEDIQDEAGNFVDQKEISRIVKARLNLLQSGIDEVNLLRNADGKYYAVRYCGLLNSGEFQYFCFENAKIVPGFTKNYTPGKQILPVLIGSLKQADSAFNIPTYHLLQTDGAIRTQNLQLWTSPRHGYNSETTKLLDASGFLRHGTLNADFATIWQQTTTPAEFLRFDGSNDEVNFGDILNDDGSKDWAYEGWVRVQGANGTLQEIIAKKLQSFGNNIGWSISRYTDNKVMFTLADEFGRAEAKSTGTLLQNVWNHFFVAVDRNGNATLYLAGVAGTPISVSTIASAINSHNLYFGRDNTNFGQVDLGDVRIYDFGAGGLPSDISTIALNHYNAEKAKYGL